MIPFSHTWPYDIILGDMYVQYCPFCDQENVLLPMKPKELQIVRDGKKSCWSSPAAVPAPRSSTMTGTICCSTGLSAKQRKTVPRFRHQIQAYEEFSLLRLFGVRMTADRHSKSKYGSLCSRRKAVRINLFSAHLLPQNGPLFT